MKFLITYELYLNSQIYRNRDRESSRKTRVISECPGEWWESQGWKTDPPPKEYHEWDGCTVLNVYCFSGKESL